MTHGPDGSGYFLYHSIGQFPGKGKLIGDALADFAERWSDATNDSQWPAALALRQEFIDRWSRVINAPPGTVITATNVTTALYSVIGALPERRRRRRVLITADCFPSLHFLLSGLADRMDFVLETVPVREGEYWVRDEDIIDRWGDDVGVALLTHVTSTASYRCNLHELVAHGRRMGTVVGVDITQGVGLVPYDVNDPVVDFTISTTLKWLCGTSGAGILYVRESLIPDCRPELRGWFSQDNFLSWDIFNFQYAPDIRRFDHATPAVLGCVASLPALKWHAQQDPHSLLDHNRKLSHALISGLEGTGLALASPREDARRGGSVMFELPAGVNSDSLIDELRQATILADCRGKILRLSPGNMTTMRGVEAAIGEIQKHLRASK